ncbi:MAG: 1,6-anhydro-N-acetylmuramyl-L-alanine amidase AmpD [Mariprofundus sp.]|nr:1,6-anhydro-N-acetylmuramyl-L-alanine amidase AmpD [Mariprofundus sp.]
MQHDFAHHHEAMRQLHSPHQNLRPAGVDIDLIVLHAISLPAGEFDMQYIEALFLGALDCHAHPSFEDLSGLQVSAHFVVDRQGIISQFVATEHRAWHAGLSSWQGREACNDYAIGIEMIGDEQRPFTAAQYRETARLCRRLMQRYPAISTERIVGHKDIAPDRKWDPGIQWDWQHFHRSLERIRRYRDIILA